MLAQVYVYLLPKAFLAKSFTKFDPLEITNPERVKSSGGKLLCAQLES